MRYVTSNTKHFREAAPMPIGPQPRALNFEHCWLKRSCNGAVLPEERRTGGICSACTKSEKSLSPIAAFSMNLSSRPVSQDGRFRRPLSQQRRKPMIDSAFANAKSEAKRIDHGFKKHTTVDWSARDVPVTVGSWRRISDVMMHGYRTPTGTKPMACVKAQCICGRGERVFRIGDWLRTHNAPSACLLCLNKRNQAHARRRHKARREAAKMVASEQRRAA